MAMPRQKVVLERLNRASKKWLALADRLMAYADAADGRFSERPLDVDYQALARDCREAAQMIRDEWEG